tara:strand:+ start:9217 stop:9600 length:384 start_codon:yes stop_codon:yes gene_type:complete
MSDDLNSLYERLGGQEKLAKIVFDMYQGVLADEDLAPFFENVPMDRLNRMNTEFIASALDGPIRYTGAELVAVHSGRGIQRKHFSAFVSYLAEAMRNNGVEERLIDDVLGRVAMYAGKITGDANIDG